MPSSPDMATAAPRDIIHLSPPLPSGPTPCDPHLHSCRWWPYSSSSDFGANTVVIIIILLCVLIFALALNTAIRCFLHGGSHRDRLPQTQQELDEQRKPNNEAGAAPLMVASTLVYCAGMKLGGVEAECAICLSEFVEGEGIRVMGRCKHGFHAHCIEQWLSSNSSCPTCRRDCLASNPSSPENAHCSPRNSLNESSNQQVLERAPDQTLDAA